MKKLASLRYGLWIIVSGIFSLPVHASDERRAAEPMLPNKAIIASVNGQPVTQGQFLELLKARVGTGNPFDEPSPQEEKERRDALANVDRDKALHDLIAMEVLAQKAREQGLHLRSDIAAEAELQYKTLLQQTLVREWIADIKVTPDEIAARYAVQKPDRQYKLSHILLKDERSARIAIAALEKGSPFEKIAHQHTLDKHTRKDGNLGWLMLNQLEEPFADATRNLNAGQFTRQPVQTSYGWHVIRLHETRDLKKPSLDDMRSILRSEILQEKVQARMQELLKEAKIEIIRPQP
jgi:peptidyl-prolyl cis-trans isomerase C